MRKEEDAHGDMNRPSKWMLWLKGVIVGIALFYYSNRTARLLQEQSTKRAKPPGSRPKKLLSAPDQEWLPQDLDMELQFWVLVGSPS